MKNASVMSLAWLLGIYLVLLVLLASTIFAAHVDLGAISLLICLAIAAAKTILVVLYFMHVRFASPVTRLFVSAGIIWLSVLFILTFGEYVGRTQLSRTTPLSTAAQSPSGGQSAFAQN